MSRPEKLAELTHLVQYLNILLKVKSGGINEHVLEPNGKGFILRKRLKNSTMETLTNYKQNSIREMTKFVNGLIQEINKTLTKNSLHKTN